MFKFLVFLFLCLQILQPEKAVAGTKEGLLLWYNAVLPAQLPFVMGVQVLMKSFGFHKISPILINFILGMIAGYPMGSMTTAQLYRNGRVSKKNLTALAAFSNMAGPLFVLGTIGVILLENIYYGYLLLVVQWTSAVLLSVRVIFKEKTMQFRNKEIAAELAKQSLSKQDSKNEILEKHKIGNLLGDAMGETAQLMLKIAGFIVLFSVLKQWVGGAGGALMEMSSGIRWIVEQNIGIQWKLVGCSFLINFSGFCVILQSLGVMEGSPVSALEFMGRKLLQGFLAAGIMLVICQFLNL